MVGSVAVELAFRRYLSQQNIPFDIRAATPFSEPDRYNVNAQNDPAKFACISIRAHQNKEYGRAIF